MAKFFTPSKLSENIKETPEGFLICLNVPVARTGWQDYGPGETPLEVGEDGKVWIYRDTKEVFRPQTVASFNAKSMTVKHPEDFVVPLNWKELTVGIAQNIRKGDELDEDGEEMLLADLLITDELAIGLVKNGLREVSCGYDAEYEETEPGEGRQFNIVGNHIALVEQGRAGSAYAIKDHKGKEEIMTLKEMAEQLKKLGKTVDTAIADDEAKKAKLAKKKAKTGDEGEKTPEQVTYDDLVKKMADMNEKLDGMMGSKKSDDEDEEESEKSDDEEMSGDDESDEDKEVGQNGRLEKCEAAIAKILKLLSAKKSDDEDESEEDMSGDEDESEEDGDESEDDSEEMEDEEGEEAEESQKKKKTGDEAKFEILTPGKKYKGKDARVKCLKEFAKSDEGAKVLKQLGMAKPVFDAKTNTDMIFMAASAIVKSKRGNGLAGTKDGTKWKAEDMDNTASEGKTAEELNEINAKHYAAAK